MNSSDVKADKVERVLVGITVQENSRRLIKKGAEIAKHKNGQLHILHVQKGTNIFTNSYTPELLQELYEYASGLGAETHAVCGEDIGETLIKFIKDMKITTMILGERPEHIKINSDRDIITKIHLAVPELELVILKRNSKNEDGEISYISRFAQ